MIESCCSVFNGIMAKEVKRSKRKASMVNLHVSSAVFGSHLSNVAFFNRWRSDLIHDRLFTSKPSILDYNMVG